jgi:UDP-N-acetyl-D-mannosaminuronate dehydrogenase
MENTYRDVNIALANELAGICQLSESIHGAIGYANKIPANIRIRTESAGTASPWIPVLKEVAPYNSRLT